MTTHFHNARTEVNAKTARAFRGALVRWFRRNKRELPWRATRDPYAVWVSEIMLQQTRVETVIPYFARWLRAFPTAASLARAPFARALKLWEGLGYYSRARNLHRAAKLVAKDGMPREAEALRRLPGIGRYTAGAIASIAFDERAPIVDGNVSRVFARVFSIRANVKLPATQRRLWSLAEQLLPPRRCGEFNEALMELGALVCLPVNPKCSGCPLRRVCASPGDALPNRGGPPRATTVTHDVVFARRGGKVLMRRRPSRGLLAGMWELPPRESRRGRLVLTLRHAITDKRITLRVWECASRRASRGCRWVRAEKVALPAAHRRAVEKLVRLAQYTDIAVVTALCRRAAPDAPAERGGYSRPRQSVVRGSIVAASAE
jgi:A/G-specific adenine glycosylase